MQTDVDEKIQLYPAKMNQPVKLITVATRCFKNYPLLLVVIHGGLIVIYIRGTMALFACNLELIYFIPPNETKEEH